MITSSASRNALECPDHSVALWAKSSSTRLKPPCFCTSTLPKIEPKNAQVVASARPGRATKRRADCSIEQPAGVAKAGSVKGGNHDAVMGTDVLRYRLDRGRPRVPRRCGSVGRDR